MIFSFFNVDTVGRLQGSPTASVLIIAHILVRLIHNAHTLALLAITSLVAPLVLLAKESAPTCPWLKVLF